MGDNLFEAALLLRSPSQNRTVSDAKTDTVSKSVSDKQ